MIEPSREEMSPATTIRDAGGDTFGFLDRLAARPGAGDAAAGGEASEPPYVLRGLIGQGGQADVWEAWQTSLHRLVALKIHRRGTREEFLREALLTGELDHPNIVPVLDIDEGPGDGAARLAMAMKRIRGRRWDDLIAEDRAAGAADGLRRHLEILQSVCRAVSYAHARGIVHLDLKPGQVMVGEFGEVYLMDWGVAARLDAASRLPARHAAEIVSPSGTPWYMAPEQALGDGSSIGIATDVYLLGGLAYHAACGRPPHPGRRVDEVMEAARRNEVVPMDAGVPEGLRRIVARATSMLPAARHGSAEEFRREIEEFMASLRQAAEARQLAASVAAERARLAEMDYPALARLEQTLERAEALAPGEAATRDLRDEVLAAHHGRALRSGDLALARIVAERLGDGARQEAALCSVAAEEDARHRRDAQRRRARRVSITALSCAVAVLLGSSYALRRSLATASAERGRAESALVQSRRELARASVQAAMSHLEHQRDAEAREALMNAPEEFRGWEWGYLAGAAMPEERLLRPRDEKYAALAASADGSLVGAIRSGDGALVLLDADASEGAATLLVDERAWSVVAAGSAGTVLVGTREGEVLAFDASGARAAQRFGDGPIAALAADGEGGGMLVADSTGDVWRVDGEGARTMVASAGGAVTALSAMDGSLAIGTEAGRVLHAAKDSADVVTSTIVHEAPVLGIAWHPSRALFATWAATPGVTQPLVDGRAAVHVPGDAVPVHVRESDGFAVTAVAWAPRGDLLYLASANTTIHEHDASTWRRVRTLLHPVGIARGMDFTREEGHLTTFTWRNVEIRAMEDGALPRSVRADSRRILGHAMRQGDMVLCGSDGSIGAWRTDRDEHARNFQVHRERGLSLDLAAGAPVLASGHQTGKIMLWSSVDPDRANVREAWFGGAIGQVRLSDDGRTLAALEEGRTLHVIRDAALPEEVRASYPFGTDVAAIALSPAGDEVIAAPVDGGLVRMRTDAAGELERAEDGKTRWTALLHGRGGRHLAAGSSDGAVALLDAETFGAIWESREHAGAIRRLCAADGGALLLSASADETARLWDAKTGRCVATFRGTHAAAVTSAALTPDGRRVLTSCLDSVVRVFDRESAVELLALEEHQYGVLDMVLSADGRLLFTTGQDSRLRAWFALPPDMPDDAFRTGVARWRAAQAGN